MRVVQLQHGQPELRAAAPLLEPLGPYQVGPEAASFPHTSSLKDPVETPSESNDQKLALWLEKKKKNTSQGLPAAEVQRCQRQHEEIRPAAALARSHPAPVEPRHAEAATKMRQTFGVSVKQISSNQ